MPRLEGFQVQMPYPAIAVKDTAALSGQRENDPVLHGNPNEMGVGDVLTGSVLTVAALVGLAIKVKDSELRSRTYQDLASRNLDITLAKEPNTVNKISAAKTPRKYVPYLARDLMVLASMSRDLAMPVLINLRNDADTWYPACGVLINPKPHRTNGLINQRIYTFEDYDRGDGKLRPTLLKTPLVEDPMEPVDVQGAKFQSHAARVVDMLNGRIGATTFIGFERRSLELATSLQEAYAAPEGSSHSPLPESMFHTTFGLIQPLRNYPEENIAPFGV